MTPAKQIIQSLGHWLKSLGYKVSINDTTAYIDHPTIPQHNADDQIIQAGPNQAIATLFYDPEDTTNDTLWILDVPNETTIHLSDPHLHGKILTTITQPPPQNISNPLRLLSKPTYTQLAHGIPTEIPIEIYKYQYDVLTRQTTRPTSPGPPGTPI